VNLCCQMMKGAGKMMTVYQEDVQGISRARISWEKVGGVVTTMIVNQMTVLFISQDIIVLQGAPSSFGLEKKHKRLLVRKIADMSG